MTTKPIPEADLARLRRGPKTWTRFRFEVPCEDCRPVKFPPPGPWWETGTGFNGSTVVAFMPGPPKEARKLVMKFWPDACRFSSEDECPEGPTYSSRFTKPSWWKGV